MIIECELSSAIPCEWDNVVGLEAVEQSPETVLVLLPELLICEIGGKVSHFVVLRPNLVASMKKLVGECFGVRAVELGGLYADVVEADVYRLTFEPLVFLLIESVAVKVIMQCVIVYHLRYGKVMEEARVVCDVQVF